MKGYKWSESLLIWKKNVGSGLNVVPHALSKYYTLTVIYRYGSENILPGTSLFHIKLCWTLSGTITGSLYLAS